MKQLFITIDSGHSHKLDMRIDDYQEWLQGRLDKGEPWSEILAEIEASNENNKYFKTDTVQTLIDGLNNEDLTNYFAVLNISDSENLLQEIDKQITEIENDARYKARPASVFSNAPLALIQTEMKTQIKTLKWVKEQLK